MKNMRYILAGTVLATVFLMAYLSIRVAVSRHRANGFERYSLPPDWKLRNTLYLNNSNYYFAHMDSTSVYLGHYQRPLHLLELNPTLTDSTHWALQIQDRHRYPLRSLRLSVQPPYFYLSDGTLPIHFRGRLGQRQAAPFMQNKSYFIDFLPINRSSFALRLLLDRDKGQVLAYETTTGVLAMRPQLLQKQLDGQFCVEGSLHYDAMNRQVVYVYSYRNQFIVMDSTLRLIHRFHTIDTNYHVKMKVATVQSNGQHTLASPPMTVNQFSCLDQGRLYILSSLRADNEKRDLFQRSSAIDIYNLSQGTYLGSIILPIAIQQFGVQGNRIYTLYKQRLSVYDYQAPWPT